MNNSTTRQPIEEDEIDLRELFATIARYKWSIFFLTLTITLAVTVKVYFMPKYYKSTVMIEIKSDNDKSSKFSLGGAGALLGMGGGATANLEKDVFLLKTFKINEKVLDTSNPYMVRYFIEDENYKEVELDKNISINITNVKINDFKNYGMRLIIKPLNKMEYNLYLPKKFKNEFIGNFHYTEMVKTENFSLIVEKKASFFQPYIIQLSGAKRYIYENIIAPNLTIELDKDSPFITISLIDNLPNRGEKYLKNLITTYTKQSIQEIKEKATNTINFYNKELRKMEKDVDLTSNKLEKYEMDNNIIQSKAQTAVLVTELSNINIQLEQNNYQKEILQNLISFVKKNNDIDTIAPSLVELHDEPTISLIKIIQEQQLSLENLYLKYNKDNPHIINTHSKIKLLKKKVLSNLQNLQKTLKSKNKSLKKIKTTYKVQMKSAPKQKQKLITFSRDYALNSKMYSYLMQERFQTQLKRDKSNERFKIIEEVYTSKKAIKPKKTLIVIVAFIAALILSIFLVFFRNSIKK